MKSQPIRVWDKEKKTMAQMGHLMPCVDAQGDVFGVFSVVTTGEAREMVVVDPSKYVIMFATGHKDATGAMIFDGDIVEGDAEVDMGEGMPDFVTRKRGFIRWNDTHSRWTITVDGEERYTDDFSGSTLLGNLFEHPQLLTQ